MTFEFIKRRMLLLTFLLFASPAIASAQSVLVFPRVISGDGQETLLQIENPTTEAAMVTLTAYGASGELVSGVGVRNPVTMRVVAGGQVSETYAHLFGGTAVNGWVRASSVVAGLRGSFLNRNTGLSDVDGSVAGGGSVETVLPLATGDAAAQMEVTAVNAGDGGAVVTVELWGSGGQNLGSTEVVLAARALTRQTLGEMFSESDLTGVSHVRTRGTSAVVALGVLVDYPIDASGFRREALAMRGRTATAATRQLIPQFSHGGGWFSVVGVVSTSTTAQDVVLTARADDGLLWPGAERNPVTVTVPGNGSYRGTIAEVFGAGAADEGTLDGGWLEVMAPAGYVVPFVALGNLQSPGFALVEGVDPASRGLSQVLSNTPSGGGYFSGITSVNGGSEAAELTWTAMMPDGTRLGQAAESLAPGERSSTLVRDRIPAMLGQADAWILMQSTAPGVVAASLVGTTNGLTLVGIPAQEGGSLFVPPAPVAAAISGVVRQNGVGTPDVTVSLEGPVDSMTRTDPGGRYVFARLTAGEYRVTATGLGGEFAPAERVIQLGLDNVSGQDFEAGGITEAAAPVLTRTSPASAFSGSGLLNLQVHGANFNPASYVRFAGTDLATTFASSGELWAVVPSALLAVGPAATIEVVTPPPGGGMSAGLPFAVNPLPDDPLIEGRVQVQSFPAGVAIHPERNVAVVTNAGSDTVSVVNLQTQTVEATVEVGRSPSEGVAIARDRDIAVVANPGSDDVSVIDLGTNMLIATVAVGRFPIGVAIHDGNGRAYVTNAGDASVSVIDLGTFQVVDTIPVGGLPSGIALGETDSRAVIADRERNAIAILDTTNHQVIRTVSVGRFPRAVAVDPTRDQITVVNTAGNTAMIVNLTTGDVERTVPVGIGPSGVAIDPQTGFAVVSNSEVVGTNVSALGEVSIIDLRSGLIVESLPSGSAPFGVGIDPSRQRAVVANFGSNDVTIIRLPNPIPLVESVAPKTFSTSGRGFTITVRGSGFLPISVVTLNGLGLATTYGSPTQLQADVPGSLISELLQVSGPEPLPTAAAEITPFTLNVGVTSGDKQSPPGNSGENQIQPQNPVPVLFTMATTQSAAGADLNLTLYGNNFNRTSIVHFGSGSHSPIASAATAITVRIPGSELAAGSYPVVVTNPAPGGGTTAALTFTVTGTTNPVPVVTQVSPQSVPSGSGDTPLAITGSGFIPETVLILNGQALDATVTPTVITSTIPAGLLAESGAREGLVSNPAPGGGTAPFAIDVPAPVPIVIGFSPESVDVGTSALDITVEGENFTPSSVIRLGGAPVPTSYVSRQRLIGRVPGSFLSQTGSLPLTVYTPPPGGGTASGGNLRVQNPSPTLTGLMPSRVFRSDLPVTVTIEGTGFIPASVVSVDGMPVASSLIHSLGITFMLAASTATGVHTVSVANPAPGGGDSGLLSLVVEDAPTLTSVSPPELFVDLPLRLTVIGSSFKDGARIRFNGRDLPTRFVADTRLTALVTPGAAGPASVTVVNPDGIESNAIAIIVTELPSSVPEITALQPSGPVPSGGTVLVIGNGFLPNTAFAIDGLAVAASYLDPTRVSLTLPGNLTDGPHTLTGTNPPSGGGGGGRSNFKFQVGNAPVTFTVFPSSVERLPSGTEQFTVIDPPAGATFDWLVHGVGGGNSTFGTITSSGFYTAPYAVPSPPTFEVCAELSGTSNQACASVTIRAVPSAGEDIVVFNDVNPFDTGWIDDPNNQLMVHNLVSFTSSGPRDAGTVVQFDCGRNSEYLAACSSFGVMETVITDSSMTVSDVPSSSGTLTSIAADVKVLFLWLPSVPYTGVEINALKQFAADGGRIVFVGEHAAFYHSIDVVQNPFLLDMGAKMRNTGGAFVDCGTVVLPAGNLAGHQITTGMTQVSVGCSSVIEPGPNDYTLYTSVEVPGAVLSGVAKIDPSPIATAVPTLTGVSPGNYSSDATRQVEFVLTGTDFTPGSRVSLSGASVTLESVDYQSPTTIKVTLTINLGTAGSVGFTVLTGNGATGEVRVSIDD